MTQYTAKAVSCGALAFLGGAGAYAAGPYAFWPVAVCAWAIYLLWDDITGEEDEAWK